MPELALVAHTGADDEALALAAIRAGAHDYLIKGEAGPREVFRAIRDAIERRRADTGLRLMQRVTRAIAEARDFDAALAFALQEVCQTTGWAWPSPSCWPRPTAARSRPASRGWADAS